MPRIHCNEPGCCGDDGDCDITGVCCNDGHVMVTSYTHQDALDLNNLKRRVDHTLNRLQYVMGAFQSLDMDTGRVAESLGYCSGAKYGLERASVLLGEEYQRINEIVRRENS